MALSIEERKLKIIEDVCATCGGGDSDGGASEPASADDGSAQGGYDQLMKGLKMLDKKKSKKKEVKEGARTLPVTKMLMKAGNLELKDVPDREKRMKNLDRARKIRSEIK